MAAPNEPERGPRIVLLPAALADQIAAGEVVERPASVVKELVENALDAGARRIEVEIERGGLGRIVVADDGDGMTPAEAHLALRRHATSKLGSAEDLFRLSTFGFRGEALPSIASISELTLTTRRAAATAGYAVTVRGGDVIAAREVGAPPGTRVEVTALFSNVPARLKFQKAAGTEASHILDGLVRTALSAHEVHLRARVDGRVVLELPAHRTLGERAQAVLRRTAGRGTRVATGAHREGEVHVEVHLAPPDTAQQSARRVHLLVNRRVVRDRGLLGALQLGYGAALERGRHPLAVVAITLPGADVDVNVHPQKLEVRLARPAEVFATVRHAVAAVVAEAGYVVPPAYAAADVEHLFAEDTEDEGLYADERGRAFELVTALARGEDWAPPSPRPSTAVRHLGALAGGYVLFSERGTILVLDQHAASALVRRTHAVPEVVTLCQPQRLELDATEQRALSDHPAFLAELGFPTKDGALLGHPPWAAEPVASLREILAALADGGEEEGASRAASLAAVSPAAELDAASATALLDAVRAIEHASDEPRWRGRRALLTLPLSELIRRLES